MLLIYRPRPSARRGDRKAQRCVEEASGASARGRLRGNQRESVSPLANQIAACDKPKFLGITSFFCFQHHEEGGHSLTLVLCISPKTWFLKENLDSAFAVCASTQTQITTIFKTKKTVNPESFGRRLSLSPPNSSHRKEKPTIN